MATKQTLAPLERKVFRSYWQDGVIDILAGISSILIGLGWLVDLFPITLGVPASDSADWIRPCQTLPPDGSPRQSNQAVADSLQRLVRRQAA